MGVFQGDPMDFWVKFFPTCGLFYLDLLTGGFSPLWTRQGISPLSKSCWQNWAPTWCKVSSLRHLRISKLPKFRVIPLSHAVLCCSQPELCQKRHCQVSSFHFPLSFPRELSPILQHSPGASGISQPIPWAGWPPQMGVIHLTEMVRDFLIILLSFLSAVSSGMGLVWAESLSATNLLPSPLQFLLMLFWLSFALDLPYSSELRISLVGLFID